MKKILIVLMLGLFFGIAPIALQASVGSNDTPVVELHGYTLNEVFSDVLHPLTEYMVSDDPTFDIKNDYLFSDLNNQTITDFIENAPVVNSIVKNGNAVNTSNWTTSNGTLTATSNVFSFTASAQNGYFRQGITLVSGHKYYIKAQVSVASNAVSVYLNDGLTDFATVSHSASDDYETLSVVGTAGASGSFYITIKDARASGWTAVLVKNITAVDLTALGTHPNGTAWASMTASQIDAYIGDLDTTTEIVAKAVAGGETSTLVTNGTFASNVTGWTNLGASGVVYDAGTSKLEASAALEATYQQIVATTGKTYAVKCRVMKNSGTNAMVYILPKDATTGALVEAMSADAFNNAPIGIWVTYYGIFTVTNGGFRIIFGRNSSQTFSLNIDDIEVYEVTNYFATETADIFVWPDDDFWYSIYTETYDPSGIVEFGTETFYLHESGFVYNLGNMLADDIYSLYNNKLFSTLTPSQLGYQTTYWESTNYIETSVLSFTDYLVYDEDGVLADMLGWYQNYLDNITAEELEIEMISDNEEIILIITMILFIIGVVLAIYTKNRVLFMASGLLFFVPIFIVDNLFIILFSIIMILMMGVIAFYQPNKEGFES